jgi:hypothetical protein
MDKTAKTIFIGPPALKKSAAVTKYIAAENQNDTLIKNPGKLDNNKISMIKL